MLTSAPEASQGFARGSEGVAGAGGRSDAPDPRRSHATSMQGWIAQLVWA